MKITRVFYRTTAIIFGFLCVFSLSACVSDVVSSGPNKSQVNVKKSLDLHISLAKGYVAKGNRESARLHLRKAFDIDKKSPEATDTLALLYQLEGEPVLAEETFKKALKLKKDFTEAHNNYGIFLYQSKRYEQALVEFELASADLDYDGRSVALVNLGRTALKLGRNERARAAFTHANILDRNLADAYIELAEMNLTAQEYPEAKQNLDKYMALTPPDPRSLLLGIRLERIFDNKDKEASYALMLKNKFPYSREYLEYKDTIKH